MSGLREFLFKVWLSAFAAWIPLAAQAAPARVDVRHEIECLALTIYFEARGEPDQGKLAVGHVVMNRVSDPRYPSWVCDVVRQGGEWPHNRCQFSWWCDGRSDQPKDRVPWERSKAFARLIYWGFTKDPTAGALWYHADYVRPVWRKVLGQGPKIGRHIFYYGNRKGAGLPMRQATVLAGKTVQ
ncbi:MAG: cell wall hydrolase [Alphaproteobacteria bacterium]